MTVRLPLIRTPFPTATFLVLEPYTKSCKITSKGQFSPITTLQLRWQTWQMHKKHFYAVNDYVRAYVDATFVVQPGWIRRSTNLLTPLGCVINFEPGFLSYFLQLFRCKACRTTTLSRAPAKWSLLKYLHLLCWCSIDSSSFDLFKYSDHSPRYALSVYVGLQFTTPLNCKLL